MVDERETNMRDSGLERQPKKQRGFCGSGFIWQSLKGFRLRGGGEDHHRVENSTCHPQQTPSTASAHSQPHRRPTTRQEEQTYQARTTDPSQVAVW